MTIVRMVSLSNISIVKPCKELQKYYDSLYNVKVFEYEEPIIEYSSEKYEDMRDYLEMENNDYIFDQPEKFICKNLALSYTNKTIDIDFDIESKEYYKLLQNITICSKLLKVDNPSFNTLLLKQSEKFVFTSDLYDSFNKYHIIYNKLVNTKYFNTQYTMFEKILNETQQLYFILFYQLLKNSINSGILYIF